MNKMEEQYTVGDISQKVVPNVCYMVSRYRSVAQAKSLLAQRNADYLNITQNYTPMR